MTQAIFLPQSDIEACLALPNTTFDQGVLTVPSRGTSLRLTPAVRITTVVGGEDTRRWVGEVFPLSQLDTEGAEHYHDSLIIDDTAYECEEGFIGYALERDPSGPASDEGRSEAVIQRKTTAEAKKDPQSNSDADLLADFLLQHLSK